MKTKQRQAAKRSTTSKRISDAQLDRAFDAAITLGRELGTRYYAAQFGTSVAAMREIVNVLEGTTEPRDQECAAAILTAGDRWLATRLMLVPDRFSQWLDEYYVDDEYTECPRDLVGLPALRRVADAFGVSLN